MTSSTLWFNNGIFKNTLKRFKWGSFLYFVILFFSVPFIILVDDFNRLAERYINTDLVSPLLFRSDYILIPLLLATVVPTVVAALIFNNVHSGKQSIFVHGLPVNRGANYVSSILAAFVLMAIPVVLNAGILLIMSFTDYGQLISSWSVIYWLFINLSILFIMFSVSSFTAFLTGNAAAHIAINAFLHIIPLLVALAIALISDIFLFGFVQSDNFVANEILENTPIVWLFAKTMSLYRGEINLFAEVQMWAYLFGAAVVYILGFLLYKNRKIEAAGDVAAFKLFKPILKYATTTAAAVCIFGIMTSMNIGAIAIFVVASITTAIVFFACEMLIRKSFKVFGTYKGYIGFAVFCAVFISFFAYTGVFGYETRIPAAEDIESAAVSTNWNVEKCTVADKALIEETRKIHEKLTEDIPTTTDTSSGVYRNLRIMYKLTNGKTLERLYLVSEDTAKSAMTKMYESTEYKLKATEIANLNIENIDKLVLSVLNPSFNYNFALNDDASELMENIKKDVESLGYEELEYGQNMLGFQVNIDCSYLENLEKKIFKSLGENQQELMRPEDIEYAIKNFSIELNSNFKNTYAFLKERGYYDEAIQNAAQGLWICNKPINRAGELYTYKGEVGKFEEFQVSPSDCTHIELEDAIKIAIHMANTKHSDIPEGKSYFVFNLSRYSDSNIWLGSRNVTFSENALPEYLKKYIKE